MVWFDIKELENKISNNELTDKDGFSYVLAFIVFTAIALSFGTNNSNGWIKLANCVITVLINVWGLKAVYEVNNGIDGKDFFKRFFAINWVIGMRLLVVSLIFIIIAAVVIGIVAVTNGMHFNDSNPVIDILVLIFSGMVNLICYLLTINSFHRLKKTIK